MGLLIGNFVHCYNNICSCIPGAPLTNLMMGKGGGGGVQQRFIFYTQQNHNFRICLPKKITIFFSIPKIPQSFFHNPKKFLCFFSRPKKLPASFIDPKKSLWAKISDPKKIPQTPPPSPVIKICEWGPWVLYLLIIFQKSSTTLLELVQLVYFFL